MLHGYPWPPEGEKIWALSQNMQMQLLTTYKKIHNLPDAAG